jgi:hypothetical protein
MRLRPRHYVFIAVILALGVYNLIRSRRLREQATAPAPIPAAIGPIPQSAAWHAFDQAAALRDAPDPQFQPALHNLNQQIASATAPGKTDLEGCQTWLLFYRESAQHASASDAWKQRSTQHLNVCASRHRDVSS